MDRVSEEEGAADFRLQGLPVEWERSHVVDEVRRSCEPLPAAFTTIWVSDHLQHEGAPWPEGWTRLTYLAAAMPDIGVSDFPLSFDTVAELHRFVEEVVPRVRLERAAAGAA